MIKTKEFLKHVCILVSLGVILVITGCSSEKAAQTNLHAKQVQQTPAKVIEAAGKIKANDIKNITLGFSASVQAVNVKEGQQVKLGDELISLDIHDFKQQIIDRENELKQGKLQLEITKNNISDAEKELRRLASEAYSEKNNNTSIQLKENDYKQALEVLNRAREDFSTKNELYQSLSIPKSEMETEQRRVEDAEKSVNDKKLSLDDARCTREKTLDKLQTGVNQQRSNVSNLKLNFEIQKQKLGVLESDIKQLKDKLNKSYIKDDKIVSDIKNGLVQEIVHIVGDSIQANTKLLNLVNMDSLTVEAEVSEDFIKDVKPGAEVEIFPLSDSAKKYKGRVLKTADMGIEKNGETVVLTEISIDNADEFIKPNFNVDVKISK